ncbi:adenosylcobalamin-dependent ribonucleoside-diphosphate reductase [Thioalkalicoccus limnaeus]|uniref:Vitamin B12-dependent ribonucleotide reductase n=1 Tax=Thioalkalicoccus limnaeus TaxID=120681 RepID=A0ABV4BFY4_9GAMM
MSTTDRVDQLLQPISERILLEKYARGDERAPHAIRERVARALARVESDPATWTPVFLAAQERGLIMAGRINAAAGTERRSTWINCFVQPVGDSVSGHDADGVPGIYVALQQATETMRLGGGVGYDFSRLRPRGALVGGTGAEASGPVSYMRVFDRSCATVVSAGARRGAQMAILRCDHPDILDFIQAKDQAGELTHFNLSVAVTDSLIEAVIDDQDFALVHRQPPTPALARSLDAFQRADGLWVYRTLPARRLWDAIMASTYDHGEPGVFFVDRVNADNNLAYCETIAATNPCAEEPLPPYGCCCLASINLAALVEAPFTAHAAFDWDGLGRLVEVGVRMLDDVLEATPWPIPEQAAEARSKRRIGLGLLGLGDALIMLGLRYDSPAARELAAAIARRMRDTAYRASIALARERGPFPLFDAEPYLASGFASRLPDEIRDAIRRDGIRNSHLLSVAPTGTISLAFADNASNGIEPAYSWFYQRRVRERDGGWTTHQVEDHAFRCYRALHDLTDQPADETVTRLPTAFVSALEISAQDHALMVAAIQPYVDAAISKTVNIPTDYPFADFKDLYLDAWRAGVKSLATFRPNPITGSLLSAAKPSPEIPADAVEDLVQSDPDRRVRLERLPEITLNSVRWPSRPRLTAGNPAWTFMVRHPGGSRFAVFVGHLENETPYPFEVWVTGEPPRGLAALAKTLSHDMYSSDRAWLKLKLLALMRTSGDDAFALPMPPDGELVPVPSIVSGFARLVHYRCEALGTFDALDGSPVKDALFSPKEPKTGPDGTLSWTVDIENPATGDDAVLFLKELVLPDGQRRPYSVWLSGEYPRVLDGLCKSLSYDMRVIDTAWIGRKLRKLLNFEEPQGDFLAPAPGDRRQRRYPSTVAYIATLMIHRYRTLGLLDDDGYPVASIGVIEKPQQVPVLTSAPGLVFGSRCPECGALAVVRIDGCQRCRACGWIGDCG